MRLIQLVSRLKASTFFKNVSMTFFARIFGSVLGLVVSVIISRSLGPEGRGAFSAAMALAAIGTQFGNFGLHSSNTYFLSRNSSLLQSLIANSVFFALVTGSLISITIALILFFTGSMSSSFTLNALAILWIPFGLSYMLMQNILLAKHDVRRFNRTEVISKTLTLIFAAFLFGLGAVAPEYYFASALITLLMSIFLVWQAYELPLKTLRKVSFTQLRLQIPFAFRSYLNCLFGFLLLRSDTLMVNHWSGNMETGYYSIATAIADMLFILPTTVGTILYPKLCRTANPEERKKATIKILFHITWIMALLCMISSIAAPTAISLLYGPAFLPAVAMFRILLLAVTAYGLSTILSYHLASEGLPWSSVGIWLSAVLVNLLLNVLWIPSQGGIGAAKASLASYAVTFALHLVIFYSKKRADLPRVDPASVD